MAIDRRSLVKLLGVGLLSAGCAAPAPSPTAAPTQPRPEPSPAQTQPRQEPSPAPAPATAAPAPKSLQKARLRLDFLYQGQHAPFLLARDKGMYRDNGIDLELIEGSGSGPALQLLGNKSVEFGFVDLTLMMTFAVKDVPVKAVAGIFRSTPQGFLALNETAMRTPKDLEGKTVAIVPATLVANMLPAFAQQHGVDATKINTVNTDVAAKLQLLLAKRVDVMQGAASDAVSISIETSKDPSALWLSDWGMAMVGYGIVTHSDMIKEKPDLVRGMVAATLKGFDAGREKPDDAVAAMRKALPDVKVPDSTLKLQLQAWYTRAWDSPKSKGKPTGFMPPEDFTFTQDQLAQHANLGGTLPIDRYFTNEFLPK